MWVRRIHGDRGPQPGAGGAARLFQRLDSPTGLVAVANCRLVLVRGWLVPATRTTARTATRCCPAYRRPSAGPAGPATSRPCSEADGRHSVRITRAPTQWCRRAYGRTAGAVRARRLPGASQRSRAPRLWACGLNARHWSHTACRSRHTRTPRLAASALQVVPPTPAAACAHGRAPRAAGRGLRRMRLGLLLTPAAVQRLRQFAPTSANAVSSAAVRFCDTCNDLRNRACPGQRLGRALGAPRSPQADCAAARSPRAGPRLAYATTPSCNAFAWVAASNFVRRCTSACRDNASPHPLGGACFGLASNRAFKEHTWLRATISAWRQSARASAASARATSRSYRKHHSCGSRPSRGVRIETSCARITMREMIAQYLPCYQTPTAVFLSPPVSNDSKQSSNSMTEKWSTMSADPPRTERLPVLFNNSEFFG